MSRNPRPSRTIRPARVQHPRMAASCASGPVVHLRGRPPPPRAFMQACEPCSWPLDATPLIFLTNHGVQWHSNCKSEAAPRGISVHEIGTDSVRDRVERILSSYEEIDRRFLAAGGLGSVLNLYEQVR